METRMNKLSKMIFEMEYEDLKLIKKDLDEGNISRIIEQKIKEKEQKKEIICPVCHNSFQDADDNTFTLTFGEKSFRRKATFCATDCLEYFISHIKRIKQTTKKGDNHGIIRNNEDI